MKWLPGLVGAYGAINVIGGLIGFLKANSIWSLVVGGIAGLLLIGCAVATSTRPGLAYRSAGVLALGLLIFWAYRFSEVIGQGKSPMMAAMNLALSAGVIALLGYAHLSKTRGPASS